MAKGKAKKLVMSRALLINVLLFGVAIIILFKTSGVFFINDNKLIEGVSDLASQAGFDGFAFDDYTFKNNVLVLSDVSLDQDRFSSIRNIEIKYGRSLFPPSLKIENIVISGAEIAVIFSPSGEYEIAGRKDFPLDYLLEFIKEIKILQIKSATIEADIPKIGIINADVSADFRGDHQNLNFTLSGKTVQNQLSAEFTSNGYIRDSGEWLFEGDLYNARFSGNNLKAQRISGWFSVGRKGIDSKLQFGSRLNAGILSYLDLDLHNVTCAITGVSDDYRIITEGNIRDKNNSSFYSNIGKVKGQYAGYVEVKIESNSQSTRFLEQMLELSKDSLKAPATMTLKYPNSDNLPQDFSDIKVELQK